MKINAYAKINLGLRVVDKRSDGFHNIETVFHRIHLFDEITLQHYDSISVTCTNPQIPNNNDNLCWKAVELLQREAGVTSGAKIHIVKNIPVGAGLGGGSSNAATVLKHLPALWNIRIDNSVLEKAALQLGSDVPFFLKDSTAYAQGRGEKLSYFQLRLPYWIVVVYPNIHVSTPWAYTALSERRGGITPNRQRMINDFSLARLPRWILFNSIFLVRSYLIQRGLPLILENDFEEVVFEQYPHIKEIKIRLVKLGAAYALMSGSGSSVFGLFDDEQSARDAATMFSPNNFVHLTEPDFSIG